jgi:Flp pilus assembly protein TadG
VEFALVAPILFLLILAIFEFGRAFMVTQLLTDAARRGCRLGIIEGTTTSQIKTAATSYLQSVGISGDSATVTINDGVGNIIEAQNVPANTEISVNVQVPFNSVTWLPTNMSIYIPAVGTVNLGPTGNLTGQFTLRRE